MFFFFLILKLAFKSFEILHVEMIMGWQDFPYIVEGEKGNHESLCIQAACMQPESFHNSKLHGNLSCVRS